MKRDLKETFMNRWRKYFTKAEVPIAYFYTDEVPAKEMESTEKEHRCLICNVHHVQSGKPFIYSSESPGCSSIIYYPFEESKSKDPRCILGMFDVSARPCVPENTLTFTIPMTRFVEMVKNMDESFLATESWNVVKKRMNSSRGLRL